MNRLLIGILFAVVVFSAFGCSNRFRASSGIKYRFFDSLEQYFMNDIAEHKPEKPIGVAIDAVCLDCYKDYSEYFDLSYNLYKVSLIYHKSSLLSESILEKSNRYVSIGGIYYPVYLYKIDDYFLDGYSRNRVNDYNPLPPHNLGFSVLVDMDRKTYHAFGGWPGNMPLKEPRKRHN